MYQVPDWTGNSAVSYTTQLTGDWKLLSGADYSYIGRSFSGNNDPADPRLRGSYRLINAQLRVHPGQVPSGARRQEPRNEVANLGDNRSIAAEIRAGRGCS